MADYKRIHDPAMEEHFVYLLIGKGDRLLYIGCSMNLPRRIADHSKWRLGELTDTVVKFGPYNYETGRKIEREWIELLEPPFNVEHTSKHIRGKSLPASTPDPSWVRVTPGEYATVLPMGDAA